MEAVGAGPADASRDNRESQGAKSLRSETAGRAQQRIPFDWIPAEAADGGWVDHETYIPGRDPAKLMPL